MSNEDDSDDPLDRLGWEVATLCHNLVTNSNVSDEAELYKIVVLKLDEVIRRAFEIPEGQTIPLPSEVRELLLGLVSDCAAVAMKSRIADS